MPSPKREHLLDIAESLFSKEGFKGVSVDRLIEHAGVAKMTLYKGFDSKDALIQETLKRRAKRLATHVESFVEGAEATPQKRLLACFEAMKQWSNRPDFNGCYFINALGEYAGGDGGVAEIVRKYKEGFLSRLKILCQDCGVEDPDSFAKTILLLIDGATVTHMTLNDEKSFDRAKSIAQSLLRR